MPNRYPIIHVDMSVATWRTSATNRPDSSQGPLKSIPVSYSYENYNVHVHAWIPECRCIPPSLTAFTLIDHLAITRDNVTEK